MLASEIGFDSASSCLSIPLLPPLHDLSFFQISFLPDFLFAHALRLLLGCDSVALPELRPNSLFLADRLLHPLVRQSLCLFVRRFSP